MFKIQELKREHIKLLLEDTINEHLRPIFTESYIDDSLKNPFTYVGMADGVPVACGGVTKLWEGRGHVWMILSQGMRNHSVSVFRGIKQFMHQLPFNRLELDSPCGFLHGHRRAIMFGFQLETPRARKYWPDGRDAQIFVWVRE